MLVYKLIEAEKLTGFKVSSYGEAMYLSPQWRPPAVHGTRDVLEYGDPIKGRIYH